MTALREFSTASELMEFYRHLRARTRAWVRLPAPPPPEPEPAAVVPEPAEPEPPPLITRIRLTPLQRIIIATAEEFGLPVHVVRSLARAQSVVVPRQVIALLARELTSCSYNQIGKALGHRDHSTVSHSVFRITIKMAGDAALACRVQRLRAKLLEIDSDGEACRIETRGE